MSIATNWKRAFEKVYTQIKWLNAYAIINNIAAQKILKKFTKNTFNMKDNILDKNLLYHIFNDFKFTNRDSMIPISNDIKTVYARYFCDNNLNKAKA